MFSSIVIGEGILWVWLIYWNVFVTGMLYGFAIIIETMLGMIGVLGYGFVLGILSDFVLVFLVYGLIFLYILHL